MMRTAGDELICKPKNAVIACGDITIGFRGYKFATERNRRDGFSLVELLMVFSILSLLMGIMLPALGRARQQARTILGTNNQRQIVSAVSLFAADNDDRYPESVATVGLGEHWNWQEPTMLMGYKKRSPMLYRSMSAYLRRYIEDASIMFCPNAPREYKYLREAWAAADEWINPDAPVPFGPLTGTYCLYWNYVGFLGERGGFFRGPRSPSGGWRQSKLLVTDYLGYDHWQSPGAYRSCEKFRDANPTEENWFSSAYWSGLDSDDSLDTLNIELRAGYTDGHVGSYCPSDVEPMEVIMNRSTGTPYPSGVGPGVFYLPRNALR